MSVLHTIRAAYVRGQVSSLAIFVLIVFGGLGSDTSRCMYYMQYRQLMWELGQVGSPATCLIKQLLYLFSVHIWWLNIYHMQSIGQGPSPPKKKKEKTEKKRRRKSKKIDHAIFQPLDKNFHPYAEMTYAYHSLFFSASYINTVLYNRTRRCLIRPNY